MKYCPQCASALVLKKIDATDYKVCSGSDIKGNSRGCGFVHWNNPIPVAAALVEINGQYLLARNQGWPEGFFSLLSGFIESGESPEVCIKREVMEEVGLSSLEVHFLGHFPFDVMNQLIIAFVVKAKGNIKLSDELAEYKLLSREELASYDFGMLKLGRLVADKWLGR